MLYGDELKKFIEKLETDGVEKVRQDLALGIYGNQNDPRNKIALIQNWLDEKENERQEKYQNKEFGLNEKAVSLSEEANQISKEANKISKEANDKATIANRYACWAIIISIVSMLVALFKK